VFNFYQTNHAVGQGSITKIWKKMNILLDLGLDLDLDEDKAFLYNLVHPIGVRVGMFAIYGIAWHSMKRRVHEALVPSFINGLSMFGTDSFANIRRDVLPAGAHKISFVTGVFRLIAVNDVRHLYPNIASVGQVIIRHNEVMNGNVGYHIGAQFFCSGGLLSNNKQLCITGNSPYDGIGDLDMHIANCSRFLKELVPTSTLMDSPIYLASKGIGASA
jgi:hypothetical protein